jgi:heme/copper-type cytochrome/quinol oxidase subunit 3
MTARAISPHDGPPLVAMSAYRAEMAAAHGDQTRFKRNILITLGLGIVFVVGVGIEWKEAFVHFPPSTSLRPDQEHRQHQDKQH